MKKYIFILLLGCNLYGNAGSIENEYRKNQRDSKTRESIANEAKKDGGNGLFVVIFCIAAVVSVIGISAIIKSKRADKRHRKNLEDQIKNFYSNNLISEEEKNIFINKINSKTLSTIVFSKEVNKTLRINKLNKKYPSEIAKKLIDENYWIGMTEENLIDCKGDPTKVEKEVLKTKTKIVYIYGNKSSGDIFEFENGLLSRFKDR